MIPSAASPGDNRANRLPRVALQLNDLRKCLIMIQLHQVVSIVAPHDDSRPPAAMSLPLA